MNIVAVIASFVMTLFVLIIAGVCGAAWVVAVIDYELGRIITNHVVRGILLLSLGTISVAGIWWFSYQLVKDSFLQAADTGNSPSNDEKRV